jgi:hypothetical protein
MQNENLRNHLKELNKLAFNQGRILDMDSEIYHQYEDKIHAVIKKIWCELGLDEDFDGFDIDNSYKAKELFTNNGLTDKYAWWLADGWC